MPPINPTSANGTTLPWAQFAALAQACDPRQASAPNPTDAYDSTSSTTTAGRGPGRTTQPAAAGNSSTPFASSPAPTNAQSTPPQASCAFFDINYGNFCSLLEMASNSSTAAQMSRSDFNQLGIQANFFVQDAGRSAFVLPQEQLQNCTLLAEQCALRANPPPPTVVPVTPAPPGGGDGLSVGAIVGIVLGIVAGGVGLTWAGKKVWDWCHRPDGLYRVDEQADPAMYDHNDDAERPRGAIDDV